MREFVDLLLIKAALTQSMLVYRQVSLVLLTSLVVWFTPQILVAVGPSRFYGLPGVILSMDYTQEGTDISINATSVELKSIDSIKRPSKGKKVTEDEYMKIVMERMEAMEEMMGGDGNDASSENGNVQIKISTREN